MRYQVAMVILLAACSTSPPTDVDPNQKVALAFANAVRTKDTTAQAIVEGGSLPSQDLIDSQLKVTVMGHLGAAQTRDGSWIVQVPPTGARIMSYSTTEGQVGAALNVGGTNTMDIHTAQLQRVPIPVVPGDALVVTSTYNAGAGRDAYWGVPGRSAIDEAMAVVFVPYPVSSNLLRPPAIGNSWLSRFFRMMPIPERLVDVASLPSVVDIDRLPVNWAAWNKAKPDITYLTALLRKFSGDCYDGWSTDTRTPDFQHPGYGSYYAPIVSQALVTLCSTASVEQKRPLALAVVQRGLDLVGAFSDGRNNGAPVGGHMQGRKALVIACGHLLHVEPFTNPNKYVGNVFQEDGAFRPGRWWFNPNWTAVWAFSNTFPFDGSQCANPPTTWGDVNSPSHSTWAWMMNGYLQNICGSQVGTALAMHLMGRTTEMGVWHYRMIQQWMEGPSLAARAEMINSANGIDIPWSTDYALLKGGDLCAEAWKRYN